MSRFILVVFLVGCEPSSVGLVDPDLDSDVDTEADTEVDSEVPPFVLAESISTERMVGHLEALQAIADDNDGTRLFLSSGYLDSVDYVTTVVEGAGYVPSVDSYEVSQFRAGARSARIVAPSEAARELNISVFAYSGAGTVEAPVVPVDLVLPPGAEPNSSTSGCEAADFEGFPAGSIALVQRGTCTFSTKVAFATEAGASAVLIFNEGQRGRTGLLEGVLDDAALAPVPVVGLSFADGEALAGLTAPVVSLSVDTALDRGTDRSVLITIAGRDPSRTVLIGAHLDSVLAGPGINDNGSGTAYLLDIAEAAAEGQWVPQTNVRLAWWGAEEQGLVGSRNFFLNDQGEADLENLAGVEAYLNFDMLASSNGVRFVYDGDASSTEQDIANPGSIYIEELFEAHFDAVDQPTRPVAVVTRADSYWAVALGLPWGGLFSGAEVAKTEEEAAVFGGDAGVAYDACYHRGCDTLEAVDEELYTELTVAGAVVIQQLAEAETGPPASQGIAPAILRDDLPRPYGCHDDAIFDR